jgi:hypothetical protein
MTTTTMRYAATIVLLGALVLATAMSAAGRIHSGAERGVTLAQYCAPPHDSMELHRIYCRDHG